MLDLAIVGGGLSGLALAALLRERGGAYAIFEARRRLGGRALTVHAPPRLVKDPSGLAKEPPRLALDLGPTWFWPEDNPALSRLLSVLGLKTFEQHETGEIILVSRAGAPPRRLPSAPAYATARRIVGGVGALIDALAARVGAEALRLEHELTRVEATDDGVALTFRRGDAAVRVVARQVVLALPPRLIHERVDFVPSLSPELRRALASTPTWMASHAKAVAPFAGASWRSRGDSGAALCPHPGAVLGEIFDACDVHGQAALAGFFSWGPQEREASRADLEDLVRGQLSRLFGSLPEEGPPARIQDWATERYTTAALDLEQPAREPVAPPSLALEPHWGGRLFFGGAETGTFNPGRMEGALEAALRLAPLVAPKLGQGGSRSEPLPGALEPATQAWLDRYGASVRASRDAAAALYVEHVKASLSDQGSEGVTQRSILRVAAHAYRSALATLVTAPFVRAPVDPTSVEHYVAATLAPFAGFDEQLVSQATKANLSSCALRSFAEEARPDAEYLAVIRADLQAVQAEFAAQVQRKLRPHSA
jgi:monoamine oxidase